MVLRCIVKQKGDWYESTCLELSLVGRGKSFSESKQNLDEAIESYLEILQENKDSNIAIKRAPYYWIKRVMFDIQYRKTNPNNHDKFLMERMMPLGV